MSASEDTLGAALRDYALDQLALADLQLARAGAWQQDGVHLARKAVARLRASVELLRKSPQAARAFERRLRTFAHQLSPLRDAQAALSTSRKLRGKHGKSYYDWRALARELKQHRDRMLATALADDAGFAERRAQLIAMRAALTRIAWPQLREKDLQRSLKRADKRVRRALDPAHASRQQEPRHRLRRRSRRLLLQIKLLRRIARDSARPQAAAAAHASLHAVLGKSLRRKQRKDLIDKLGREQDLRVLRRSLPARATTTLHRRAVTALRRELERAQAATNELLA